MASIVRVRKYYTDENGFKREVWSLQDGDGPFPDEGDILMRTPKFRFFQGLGYDANTRLGPPRNVMLDDQAILEIWDAPERYSLKQRAKWWPLDFAQNGSVRVGRAHRGRPALNEKGTSCVGQGTEPAVDEVRYIFAGPAGPDTKYPLTGQPGGFSRKHRGGRDTAFDDSLSTNSSESPQGLLEVMAERRRAAMRVDASTQTDRFDTDAESEAGRAVSRPSGNNSEGRTAVAQPEEAEVIAESPVEEPQEEVAIAIKIEPDLESQPETVIKTEQTDEPDLGSSILSKSRKRKHSEVTSTRAENDSAHSPRHDQNPTWEVLQQSWQAQGRQIARYRHLLSEKEKLLNVYRANIKELEDGIVKRQGRNVTIEDVVDA